MSAVEPLIDRRRRLVRADIGSVAIDLFTEQGFDAVTVDDIAAAAGISQRTFFRYFATKDEVVLDYQRRLMDRLVAAFADRPPEEGPVTALRNAYRATASVEPEARRRALQAGRILAAAPALRMAAAGSWTVHGDGLLEAVARRMKVRVTDRRVRTVVAAMTSVAAAEWSAWVQEDGRGDPADRIVTALGLLEQGLGQFDRGASGAGSS